MKKNNFKSNGATIWTVIDLKCKKYNEKGYVKIEKYSKGKILKNYFGNFVIVEFNNEEIVILNQKYILINLPDVLQKEVIYEIVNAKSAIYNIHGNEIPEVSGYNLYPNMFKNDDKIKVPLMYKTAEKLFLAENEALEKGVTIKIYDTYRPYSTSKYLYEKTLKVAEKYKNFLNGNVGGFEYSQKWFLAANASSHNYGVAMDITLVNVQNGKELEMQTKIHDLSIFSVIDKNNEASEELANIMKKQGFATLRSEWWHFQDNDSKIEAMDFQIE